MPDDEPNEYEEMARAERGYPPSAAAPATREGRADDVERRVRCGIAAAIRDGGAEEFDDQRGLADSIERGEFGAHPSAAPAPADRASDQDHVAKAMRVLRAGWSRERNMGNWAECADELRGTLRQAYDILAAIEPAAPAPAVGLGEDATGTTFTGWTSATGTAAPVRDETPALRRAAEELCSTWRYYLKWSHEHAEPLDEEEVGNAVAALREALGPAAAAPAEPTGEPDAFGGRAGR